MTLTGYHGTSFSNAENIICENTFKLSDGDEHWLGKGIYFYCQYTDAETWHINKEEPAEILHVIVDVNDDAFLDLDTAIGKEFFEDIKTLLKSKAWSFYSPQTTVHSAIKNQCAICNYIWDNCQNLMLLLASFATKPEPVPTLIDARPRRKEFCIRNNSCIRAITKLRR